MDQLGTIRYQFPKYEKPYRPEGTVIFQDEMPLNPNQWFGNKFPAATKLFGPAFLVAIAKNQNGFDVTYPLHPNEDFFAAIIGGEAQYKLQVVYHPQEDRFYFYDYRLAAFCPTNEDKLRLLISNYFLRCSQECCHRVDVRNFVTLFRNDEMLDSIIERAKTILECQPCFFSGKDGQRRYVGGKFIEPDAKPAHELFVKKAIVRNPASKLTVSDAFCRYHKFCQSNCMPALTRTEFKDLVSDVIREEFKIGLRHDILGIHGKQTHGWDGLDCPLEPVCSVN